MSCWKHVLRLRYHCRLCREVYTIPSTALSTRPVPLKILPQAFPRSLFSSHAFENRKVESNDKDERIRKKIYFSSYLYKMDPQLVWIRQKTKEERETHKMDKIISERGYAPMKPISLKYLDDYNSDNNEVISAESTEPPQEEQMVNFPLANEQSLSETTSRHLPRRTRIENLSTLNSDKLQRENIQNAIDKKWMSDYECFQEIDMDECQRLYGTAKKDIPVSKVPCGGCGAYFQCKEPSIPGYLPSELMTHVPIESLRGMVCQRCHFLKHYKIALDVRVPPAEYPSVLDTISKKPGLIVLIIDLLDLPCSIWPGITKLIGVNKPVIIVGNKVDLIPGDHVGYLRNIKACLRKSVEDYGLSSVKLKDIMLISARTGFGVEELITELQKMYEYKGDVYLLGCTNVGKSTLFNCLLQSDLCKVQAHDLVQRATTSTWPNTTLSLLKFPMLRPEGYQLLEREKRLKAFHRLNSLENRLRTQQLSESRHMYHMPSIMQFVGRTFEKKEEKSVKASDVFNAEGKSLRNSPQVGLDENEYVFRHGRWCYDTPGVSHPDQILNLLTTEELLEVIPSSSLVPRTFRLRLGQSLFIGGLARIDYLDGEDNLIWATVFAAPKLPITIVWTTAAEEVYNYCVGSKVLGVPHSGEVRLSHWPGLSPAAEPFTMCSETVDKSCSDIVLSSVGWIAIATEPEKKATILGWTPEGRGIHYRSRALLPYAIRFRGAQVHRTPMYGFKRASPKAEVEIVEHVE